MINRADERKANLIEKIKSHILKHTIDDAINDDDAFFFGLHFNEIGELDVGDGTKEQHCNIMCTSKYLLKTLNREGVGHIDGTYKVCSLSYPLVIYGITDIQGKFHPVAFMITSNESEEDFVEFYKSIKELAAELDIEFEPQFIMQDACQASYNAALNVFPNVKVLMCYYHVKAQILKHRDLIAKHKYDELMKDMTDLHYSENVVEFITKKTIFKIKFAGTKMLDYIQKQWFEGVFNKWQVFCNPPGYANTNSPIDQSFNATFKRDFTKRIKCSMYRVLNKISESVQYYSNEKNNFFNEKPKFDADIKLRASEISAKSFKKINDQVVYTSSCDLSKKYISLIDSRCYKNCSCSCMSFLKHAVCQHVVAYSIACKTDWYGIKYRQNETFVKKPKKELQNV